MGLDIAAGMARPLRIERVGGWYHVTAQGNEWKEIFRYNRDRQHFLEADRQSQRVGLSPAPDAARVRERITLVRRYPWSSYRAYIGLESAHQSVGMRRYWDWVEEPKGSSADTTGTMWRRRRARDWRKVRGSWCRSSWVLGGAEFLVECIWELAKAVEMPNYAVVATNARRYEQRLETDRTEQARMKKVRQLFNCKM